MNILQFDFIVDKSTNTVLVTREFDAELPLVWDAFTSKEILDQWWAPKPFESKTKVMNFEVGGRKLISNSLMLLQTKMKPLIYQVQIGT